MNTEKEKHFSVPADLMVDAAAVLLDAEVSNRISGCSDLRDEIEIAVQYDENSKVQQQAIRVIEEMLSDYEHFRYEETTDWDS